MSRKYHAMSSPSKKLAKKCNYLLRFRPSKDEKNAIDCFLWQQRVCVSTLMFKKQDYCQTYFAFSCSASKFGKRKCLFNYSQYSNQSVRSVQVFLLACVCITQSLLMLNGHSSYILFFIYTKLLELV